MRYIFSYRSESLIPAYPPLNLFRGTERKAQMNALVYEDDIIFFFADLDTEAA